jgi:hypothetical protein
MFRATIFCALLCACPAHQEHAPKPQVPAQVVPGQVPEQKGSVSEPTVSSVLNGKWRITRELQNVFLGVLQLTGSSYKFVPAEGVVFHQNELDMVAFIANQTGDFEVRGDGFIGRPSRAGGPPTILEFVNPKVSTRDYFIRLNQENSEAAFSPAFHAMPANSPVSITRSLK